MSVCLSVCLFSYAFFSCKSKFNQILHGRPFGTGKGQDNISDVPDIRHAGYPAAEYFVYMGNSAKRAFLYQLRM